MSSNNSKHNIIAISGGIASGKSTFCKLLEEHQYEVLYTDKIAHKILESPVVQKQLKESFPELSKEEEIAREMLAKIVFSDKSKLAVLNSIIHPNVFSELDKAIHETRSHLVFVEIPLLFETNSERCFDHIAYIYTSEKVQRNRLRKRNNLSDSEIDKRISSQKNNYYKATKSKIIIVNDYDEVDSLKKSLKKFVSLIPMLKSAEKQSFTTLHQK